MRSRIGEGRIHDIMRHICHGSRTARDPKNHNKFPTSTIRHKSSTRPARTSAQRLHDCPIYEIFRAMALRESTTVAIVGGGVSGLTTAMLLRQSGIDSIVLERQARDYVERRQRAGLVQYRGVRMFRGWGLEHLLGPFAADNTLEVRVDGETRLFGQDGHSKQAVGQLVPQQALVRALIAEFLALGGDLRFEAADVSLHGIESSRPVVRYADADGAAHEIECDFVAGCD